MPAIPFRTYIGDPVIATEQAYLAALGCADEFAVEDGRLILRGDAAELVFRPADA